MFSPKTRIFLGLVLLAMSVYLLFLGERTRAMFPLAAIAILLVQYFRSGTVWLAFRSLRAGNFAKTEQTLAQIYKPNWLNRENRAYYEMLKGLIAQHAEDLSSAAAHLRTALQYRLRTANDRSFVKTRLAQIEEQMGEDAAPAQSVTAPAQSVHLERSI